MKHRPAALSLSDFFNFHQGFTTSRFKWSRLFSSSILSARTFVFIFRLRSRPFSFFFVVIVYHTRRFYLFPVEFRRRQRPLSGRLTKLSLPCPPFLLPLKRARLLKGPLPLLPPLSASSSRSTFPPNRVVATTSCWTSPTLTPSTAPSLSVLFPLALDNPCQLSACRPAATIFSILFFSLNH